MNATPAQRRTAAAIFAALAAAIGWLLWHFGPLGLLLLMLAVAITGALWSAYNVVLIGVQEWEDRRARR